jgi:hypothetical protein
MSDTDVTYIRKEDMKFKSDTFEAKMEALQEEMRALRSELNQEKVLLVESLKAQGWTEVEHDGEYEYGHYHEGSWFVFSPNVPSEVVKEAREYRNFYPPSSGVSEEDYYDLY